MVYYYLLVSNLLNALYYDTWIFSNKYYLYNMRKYIYTFNLAPARFPICCGRYGALL